jgi:hypothetical protein
MQAGRRTGNGQADTPTGTGSGRRAGAGTEPARNASKDGRDNERGQMVSGLVSVDVMECVYEREWIDWVG